MFWKVGLERAGLPGFTHMPRWRSAAALKKFLHPEVRAAVRRINPEAYLDSLPADLSRRDILDQAQLIELETLFAGYIISAQGDRMLMAHSVEGRFPYLDAEVMRLCLSTRAELRMPGLRDKALLRRVAARSVPRKILERPKQPYRAPDAVSFFQDPEVGWVRELLSESSLRESGLFQARTVGGLVKKVRGMVRQGQQVGQSDNMAVVGILSTQWLYQAFCRETASLDRVWEGTLRVEEDRRPDCG